MSGAPQEEDNWWDQETNKYQGSTGRGNVADRAPGSSPYLSPAAPGEAPPPVPHHRRGPSSASSVASAASSSAAPPVPPPPPPAAFKRDGSSSSVRSASSAGGGDDAAAAAAAAAASPAPVAGSRASTSHRRRASRGTPWIRCEVVSSGRPVWYHSATQALVFEDPEASAAAELSASGSSASLAGHAPPPPPPPPGAGHSRAASSVSGAPQTEIMDEEYFLTAGGADPAALRRNSNIMATAWTDDDNNAASSPGRRPPMNTSGSSSSLAVGAGAGAGGSLPPRPGGRRASQLVARGGVLRTARGGRADPLTAMLSMKAHVDDLLARDLGSDVEDLMWKVSGLLLQAQTLLEEESLENDDRNCVDELLERNSRKDRKSAEAQEALRRFEESESVVAYRARAARFPHSQYRFVEWHMPQYYSKAPLPLEGSKSMTAVVLLSKTGSAASLPGVASLQSTRIGVRRDDTVADAIANALARYRKQVDLPLEDKAYVFKALGLEDYMEYGPRKLYDYAYVREKIRDGADPELVLVPRPEQRPADEETAAYPKWYEEKVVAGTRPLSLHDHVNLSTKKVPWHQLKMLPLAEVEFPFQIQILGMGGMYEDSLPRFDKAAYVYVRVFLFHGDRELPQTSGETAAVPSSSSPRWGETVPASTSQQRMRLCDLPRETRACFLVYGCAGKSGPSSTTVPDRDRRQLLGYCVDQLIDENGRLAQGPRSYRVWPAAPDRKDAVSADDDDLAFFARTTNSDNSSDEAAAVLHVRFDEFLVSVVAPLVAADKGDIPEMQVGAMVKSPDKSQLKRVVAAVLGDPLDKKTLEECRHFVWSLRHHITHLPEALPAFLSCVDWTNPWHRREAIRMMQGWKAPTDPVTALRLLDAPLADYSVRSYAVHCLRGVSDNELQPLLLQLTQCLKFEPYHDSPLARFLMERALKSPYEIGHFLFWHLKAEVPSPDFSERYTLLIEEYLAHAGEHAKELRNQNRAVLRLQRVAELIVNLKLEHRYSDEQCMERYTLELEKLNNNFFRKMGSFQVPLNPKQRATTLIVEKCRYMSSKKIPLWLVFRNADPEAKPIYIIFKSGDDLRQDILTLQLLRMIDRRWLEAGLDLRLKPYRCIATGVNDDGEGVGMIEVVLNSDTTSGIQLEYGGGAKGALKLDPLDLFLRHHNQGADYELAVENFMRSCAGYAVSTYVLGIGDRHNGNIMVTKDGHLFHIDFGHFLGNFKSKFGFKRERAPFVFTPEMAFVMGGKKYKSSRLFKKFSDLCAESFNALRKHAAMLETMFMLMVPAGMPELQCEADIEYTREKLLVDSSNKDAEKQFKKDMTKSLDSTWRRIDNWLHNVKHG